MKPMYIRKTRTYAENIWFWRVFGFMMGAFTGTIVLWILDIIGMI